MTQGPDKELWQRLYQVGGTRLRAELNRLKSEQVSILVMCPDEVQLRIAQGRAQAYGKLLELLDSFTK